VRARFLSTSRGAPARLGAAALAAAALAACAPQTVPERPPLQQEPREVQAPPREPVGPAQPITDRLGRPVDPEATKVAILLPLTGPAEDIGPAMLRAAEMAVFDVGHSDFELMPRDTRGTPEGAARAARTALREGAQLILGPLFSPSVPAAASVAGAAGVNVVAFTTDASVAGGNVLVMGFVPSQQVDRVVDFGRERGYDRFAVLAPETPYGRTVAEAMEDAAAQTGGEMVHVQFYDPEGTEFSDPAQQLSDMALARQVDAVMLPDSGLRLRTVAPLLPYYGLRGVRMLGTGLWDGAGLGREQALRGAWFAAPDPSLRAGFVRRYEENFGEPPPRLATLAYDAVALAAVLSQRPDHDDFDMRRLTDPSGFAGLDGIFRFRDTGLVQRGLAVLEVTEEGAEVVDPAPRSFAEAGI
jgi:ABC-type branched-subunit amino acid transport system substrate-binding protein